MARASITGRSAAPNPQYQQIGLVPLQELEDPGCRGAGDDPELLTASELWKRFEVGAGARGHGVAPALVRGDRFEVVGADVERDRVRAKRAYQSGGGTQHASASGSPVDREHDPTEPFYFDWNHEAGA